MSSVKISLSPGAEISGVSSVVPPTMPIFSPPTSMMALPFSLPFSTSDCEASILADSTGNFTASIKAASVSGPSSNS